MCVSICPYMNIYIYIYTHINVHTPHYICNDFSSTQFYEVNIFELLGYEGSRIPSLFIMCLGNSLKPVGILLYVHNVSTINYVYTLCIFEVVYNPHVYTCNYICIHINIYTYSSRSCTLVSRFFDHTQFTLQLSLDQRRFFCHLKRHGVTGEHK